MEPKLPNFLWNVFSVSSVGSGTSCHWWRLTVFALLLASSVYNAYVTPDIVCALEGNCDRSLATFIKGLFVRAVAGTCIASRLAVALTGGAPLARHERNVAACRAVSPSPSRADAQASARLSRWLVVCSLLLTVPVNSLRLYQLVDRVDFVPLAFAFMYAQNFSMYCIETHFAVLCFDLYRNFAGVNDELAALRLDTVARNRYPLMLCRTRPGPAGDRREICARRPTAAAVERLKIKHRTVREAAKSLNDAFGVHVGLSTCSLCLYAMFDLYYHMVSVITSKKTRLLMIYGWILQYAVRFGSVTVVAYMTTQQVIVM